MTQPTWNPMRQAFDRPPTLADFLLARIDEDEAAALNAAVPVWRYQLWNGEDRLIDTADSDDPLVAVFDGLDMDAMHAGRWYPARVLAECAAKRRIVEKWSRLVSVDLEDHPGLAGERLGLARACQLLAEPYADHPDYRPEWRP